MNLLKAQDLLKGVPDQQLQQMLQRPPGTIPPFLIASEAARRSKVRQEYQGDMQGKPPTSTVIEDLMNNMGVAALKPPGEQRVPVQAPQMPAAPQEPVQMYDGGIVAFAQGGTPSMEDVENYLAPQAGGSEMGFDVSVAPYIPALNARVRAGVLGNAMQENPQISGYQIGYEDGVNAAMAKIIPTPAGNIVGGEYRRQLGNDSEVAVRGNYNPYGEMPAMDFRQAPVSVEYMKRFANGGIASFQEGGLGDLSAFMPSYAQNIQIEELPGFEDFLGQAKTTLGASELPRYRQEIEAERARMAKEDPDSIADTLKYIGRGLVQSKSTGFMSSIAQGITSGLEMQEQAKAKNKEAQRLLRQSEIDLAAKERAERAGEYSLARQAQSDAVARRNAGIAQLQGAQQLALTGRHYQDVAFDAAERRGIDLKRLGLDEQRVGIERLREGRQSKIDEARLEELRKKTEFIGKPKPISIDKLISARVKLEESLTAQNKLKSLMSMYGIKEFGKDPAKDALVEAAYNQWIESQIPMTQGFYTGSED